MPSGKRLSVPLPDPVSFVLCVWPFWLCIRNSQYSIILGMRSISSRRVVFSGSVIYYVVKHILVLRFDKFNCQNMQSNLIVVDKIIRYILYVYLRVLL